MRLQFNTNNGLNRQYVKPNTNQSGFSYINKMMTNELIMEKIKASMEPKKEPEPQNLENSRLRWGPSTWYLFHTLSEKIKPENFMDIRDEFLNIVKSICLNLPCPSCAQHATNYMQNLNYNSIKSKEDLKIFFMIFHNYVNERNKKPLFNINQLNEKYSKAKTINIIQNFIAVFQYKSKSFNMIANEMQRNRQVEIYKAWFNKNVNAFEL